LLLARDALDWTCLAAVSAGSRFTRDPELLQALAGRRVCIVPDAGEAGHDAAMAWAGALNSVGAQVDFAPLPEGFSDLGDLVARVYQNTSTHDAGPSQPSPWHRAFLRTLFS
ncbi:MAG TPA: hypothetical protein VLE43_06725, partial [Candidatus Saccharimonadia bacterium]|nr:hypothetical protein [Candidatus Saccharimonadia bacterium]